MKYSFKSYQILRAEKIAPEKYPLYGVEIMEVRSQRGVFPINIHEEGAKNSFLCHRFLYIRAWCVTARDCYKAEVFLIVSVRAPCNNASHRRQDSLLRLMQQLRETQYFFQTISCSWCCVQLHSALELTSRRVLCHCSP